MSADETGDPLVGRTIADKYEVLRRLGTGGMGAVYEARHRETGGAVAIKVLTGIEDEAAAKRFRLEAELAASLRHPNTVRVTDFGVDEGRLYLVMELVEGDSVAERLATDGPFPWPRAVAIVRQVLKALWEAHEHPRRIVHRDIKPANIMLVDMPGEPDHVRVVDFGIARALEESGAGTRGFIGTPTYIAPELWGGESCDPRSDLYAVGCVMYELLTGAPPFVPPPSASHSLFALIDLHRSATPTPLAERAPDVPAPIAAWVERLLSKRRDARPASAREALTELDAATGHRTSVGHQSGRPGRRAPRWVTPTLAALALLATGAGLWLAFAPTGPPPGDAPAQDAVATESRAAPLASADLGAPLFRYRARLSPGDHRSPTGERLRRAPAVLARDRDRYHAGYGDPEDQPDGVLTTADAIRRFERVLTLTLDPAVSERIVAGTPLVEVSVYERGVTVRPLD